MQPSARRVGASSSDRAAVGTREPDLAELRQIAEQTARERGQKPTTTHLLAALALGADDAAQLLLERRLDPEVILRAARVTTDDAPDALARTLSRARDLAGRTAAGRMEARSIHVLFALCQESGTAAHRALVQCGTDVTRLRVASMQLAMGLAPPRRGTMGAPPTTSRPAPVTSITPSTSTRPVTPVTPSTSTRPSAPVAPSTSTRPSAAPMAPSTPGRSPSTPPPAISPPARAGSPSVPNAGPRPSAPSMSALGGISAAPPPSTFPPAGRAPAPGPRESGIVPATSKPAKAKKAAPKAGRFVLDAKAFPLLAQVGRNLTELASHGELDPVVGRGAEIERVLDILAKRERSNACLVGGPGVGKTAIARALAQRIADGESVACFEDSILVAIEPTALLAGTGVRGSLAERIGQLKGELAKAKKNAGRIIVFFDELHVLFGPDAGDEASSELKLALARGEISCIGATTEADYRRTIDADPGLSRCFTPVEIGELSVDDARRATLGVAPLFERHHDCTFSDDAISKAITWSVRYLPDRALPDKAVQILDLAGARTRRRGQRDVGLEHIAEVVGELAGVPIERLLETDGQRLLRFESLLADRIVGHGEALAKIATVLRRNASGFRSRRPIGTFLLLGPTGVGKTETAKAIAECLFHSGDAMTRLDLSEYAESHAIARLVGAPPGYIGHDSGGQLTESVRRRPYQVVLLDEIEKAHRDVLEGFLQVFDEGRLTDGRGRTVDFTNTVILLTSNIGADLSPQTTTRARIGFGSNARRSRDLEISKYQDAVSEAARKALPPELFNRFDEVLAFAPLTRDDVAEVARRILAKLDKDLQAARGVSLEVRPAAIDVLLDSGGFDPEMGARPMRRAIGRLIEAPLSEMLLRGELPRGGVACVDAQGGVIVVGPE